MADLSFDLVKDPFERIIQRHGDVLLDTGYGIFAAISLVVLVSNLLMYGPTGGVFRVLVRYSLRFWMVRMMYEYYYQPAAWLHGLSLHEIPGSVCDFIVLKLDNKQMDIMFGMLGSLIDHIDTPLGLFKLQFAAGVGTLLIASFQALCWISIAMSYGLVGILTVLGPLLFWLLMIPGTSGICANWMQGFWQYAFNRVVAAALVFAASTSVISFLTDSFHGNYTLALFAELLPKMLALMGVWAILILRAPAVVGDIFKGASSAGTNFIGAIASAKRGVLH